jgi:hypothetical protein
MIIPAMARTAARLTALLGTAYLLVATSAIREEEIQICEHAEERLRLAVSGDCGPPGQITVVSPRDECGLSVLDAAAVELPNAGRLAPHAGTKAVGVRTADWTLSGYVPATTPPAQGDAGRRLDALTEPRIDRGSDADGGSTADARYVAPLPPSLAPLVLRSCKVARTGPGTLRATCTDGDSARSCTATLTEVQ